MARHHPTRAGIALVEYALIVPLLLMLLAGVLNYSLALRMASCAASAARAGAQYGSRSILSSVDTAGIRSTALNSVPTVTGLTITSSQTCKCSDGGAVSCTGTCPSGSVSVYVQVTATGTASAIFNYPGLAFSGNTSSRVLMRVQ